MKHNVFSILNAPVNVAEFRGVEPLRDTHRKEDTTAAPSAVITVARASSWSVSSAKRFLDVIASLIALLLLSPVMLVIALLVGFTSKGPVFFAQRRVGSHGRLFTIFKFRTMEVAPPQQSGSPITVQGDRRVTRVGAVLRRFKLDELPQFYNVLSGDMSLVGPRPKLPHHEGLKMPFRPGLTGAATLAFRCEEQMLRSIPSQDLDRFYDRTVKPMKARLDSEYMESATLLSDLGILLSTATACTGLSTKSTSLDFSNPA
ncbi:MAG TPA: sugar transferase [Acidisarcina sp.]|nr:sugar transferase [Acidisarcina sp.]